MVDVDVIEQYGGTLLAVHSRRACLSDRCCIHSPSDHPLREAPQYLHPIMRVMLRVCPHGELHPDPDDLLIRAMLARAMVDEHACDGCCQTTKELEAGHAPEVLLP